MPVVVVSGHPRREGRPAAVDTVADLGPHPPASASSADPGAPPTRSVPPRADRPGAGLVAEPDGSAGIGSPPSAWSEASDLTHQAVGGVWFSWLRCCLLESWFVGCSVSAGWCLSFGGTVDEVLVGALPDELHHQAG